VFFNNKYKEMKYGNIIMLAVSLVTAGAPMHNNNLGLKLEPTWAGRAKAKGGGRWSMRNKTKTIF